MIQPFIVSFLPVPSVFAPTGSKVVRDPARRSRVRAPAKPLFVSSGSVGGLGRALKESSEWQGAGNFGFWFHRNIFMAYDVNDESEVECIWYMFKKILISEQLIKSFLFIFTL